MPTTATAVSVGKKTAAAWGNAVKADLDSLFATTVDTTVGSAAVNFSSVTASCRTMLDGKLVYFTIQITTDNALTAGSGNIADVTCFTLDAAYRPSEACGLAWGSNATGFAVMNTSGALSLWTASDTIPAGAVLRISGTWLKA